MSIFDFGEDIMIPVCSSAIVAYPYVEIESRDKLVSGCLAKRRGRREIAFFEHPYKGNPGLDLQPGSGPFLYIKTVEYKHDPKEFEPEGYCYDVILWEDRLIEISVGRLQKFATRP